MKNKEEILLAMRPNIKGINLEASVSKDELFQNQTLRPIIKLQHDIIIKSFEEYLEQHKIKWDQFGSKEKTQTVQKAYTKNSAFRNYNLGLIAGLFTKEEMQYYLLNRAGVCKRVIQIIKERVDNTLNV